MRHKINGYKLNRTSSHRSAMLANMAVALLLNEQIKTTLPKAKALRPYVERLVTKARNVSLSTRRHIMSRIRNEAATVKLLQVLGPRYLTRPGGFTQIIKAGFRYGDMASVAYIQFVDRDIKEKGCYTQRQVVQATNE